jgi:hypothetical protein
MEDGVERIVEQVVNPKIKSVIEPEVNSNICKIIIALREKRKFDHTKKKLL